MEIPLQCSHCGNTQLVEWESLDSRPLSGLYTVKGYKCTRCKMWKPVWYSTRQYDEAVRRLDRLKPSTQKFRYHFGKLLKRAEAIQRRGAKEYYGKSEHIHMAAP